MDMASRKTSAAAIVGLGLGAVMLLSPLTAQAQAASDLYYERTLMTEADRRCGLFEPRLGAALASAAQQARGAALRGGVSDTDLEAARQRAVNRARSEPCGSESLETVAVRVREAFEGFARLQTMRYPGDVADWTAARAVSRSGRVWSLSQSASFGADRLTFGITTRGADQELIAVAQFADGAVPYAARIIIRDSARSSRPYLNDRAANASGVMPLTARVTPRSATRAFLAQARFEPDGLIAPRSGPDGIAYRFPPAAAEAISRLDPREAIEIEFVFSTRQGDQTRKAYIEVGDFAAGRAFLAVAQR